MKIVLCGQRSFGEAVFLSIREAGHEVLRVFAPPPSEKGEDRLAWRAAHLGVDVREKVTESAIPDGADLIVCAHSHDFVSRRARNRAALGAIGYHPSLLPRHRGRDAVKWAVRMGDPIAGGSVYWLSEKVDGGPIAASGWCFVKPGWGHSDLWREALFPMGVRLISETLADLSKGIVVRVPQDSAVATWEPSFGREPLHRPDLEMLPPPGAVSEYSVAASAEQARDLRRAVNG